MDALEEYLDNRTWCVQPDLIPFTIIENLEELLPHPTSFTQEYIDQTDHLDLLEKEYALQHPPEIYDELYEMAQELALSTDDQGTVMEEEPSETYLQEIMMQHDESGEKSTETCTGKREPERKTADEPSETGMAYLKSANNHYNTCVRDGCCGKKCFAKLPKDVALGIILSTMRLSQEQRDSFLAAKLHSSRSYTTDPQTTSYSFGTDINMCRTAFIMCFADSVHHMHVMFDLVHESTFTVPNRSKKGKFQPKRIDEPVQLKVLRFILRQADQFGLPMPYSRSPLNTVPRIYLSPRTKKTLMTVQYNSLVTPGYQVSTRSFCRIWDERAAHVIIRDPRTDLCNTCDRLTSAARNGKRDHDSKRIASLRWNEHLDRVDIERAEYKRCIEHSRLQFTAHGVSADTKFALNTTDSTKVVSFDFAQSVSLPRHNDQAGPTFFKKLLGLSIFGIVNESLGLVYYYLFDEASCIELDGKKTHGPNAVISMLHHFLTTHSNNERHLIIYADNCVGQNKNRFVMGYLSWLVETRLFDSIRMSFMPVGHTKFAPDAFFGTLKKEFRRNDIDTPQQFVEMARQINRATAYLYGEPGAWSWKDWRRFAEEKYSAVPGIGKSYHFLLKRQLVTSYVILEHRMNLIDTRITSVPMRKDLRKRKSGNWDETADSVNDLEAMGLSETRAKYLLFQVAQHCLEENEEDFIHLLVDYVPQNQMEKYEQRKLEVEFGESSD